MTRHLEEFSEEFPFKDEIVFILENAASKFLKLKLKKKSYWYNKANAFSIMTLFSKHWKSVQHIEDKSIKDKLEKFEQNIPVEYQLAAKEGVNNKSERLTRNKYLEQLLIG